MRDISTDREKSSRYFSVLHFKIPYSVPEISPFYLWGSQPLLLILKGLVTKYGEGGLQNGRGGT